MSHSSASNHVVVPPTRSVASILVLLTLVISVTAQLITGLYMTATGNKAIGLIHAHAAVGLIALVVTITEWIWLSATFTGRFRLRSFVSKSAGPTEWSEGAFLVLASITVFLGAVLASGMYLGVTLPANTRESVFMAHQGLAQLLAVVYVGHSAFAMVRARKRAAARCCTSRASKAERVLDVDM